MESDIVGGALSDNVRVPYAYDSMLCTNSEGINHRSLASASDKEIPDAWRTVGPLV